MNGEAMPPFGEGCIAARYDREQELFEHLQRRYEEWWSNIARDAIEIRENHDPGDEDRVAR